MNVNLEYNGQDGISVQVCMCLGVKGINMLLDLMKPVKQEDNSRCGRRLYTCLSSKKMETSGI